MKFKKFFPIFMCSLLVAGGSLLAIQSVSHQAFKEARADTDVGEIAMGEVRNAISNASTIYLLPTENYGLPDSWDYAYTGVGEEDGIFINGVKQAGASLKYAGTGSAFITFYYGLPSAANEGDLVEFKGKFASATSGYSFTMNYSTSRFAETWVHALEDYDVVSFADANLPNFENVAIETSGAEYAHTGDPAGLPKVKGYFGVTNDTGSYAFQFNHKKTTTGTGWAHVLVGGSGTLWSTGHFIDFGFLDAWGDNTGHAQIKEMQGNGNNWAADTLKETGAIALNWNVGETNLLEMGSIKLKASDQRFIFFKVNGTLKFGEYWTLNSGAGAMTTRVTIQYGGDDATFSNSIEPASTTLSAGTYVPGAKQLYLNMAADVCPAVNNWDYYFKSADQNGLKYNGENIGNSNWNYFKKTGAQTMFLALGDIGITPVTGDILYVGGIFKALRTIAVGENNRAVDPDNPILYKVNFADSYFQFDGEAWRAVDPAYTAYGFARDLLKQTLAVCSISNDGNGAALADVWADLKANYYSKLLKAQQDILGEYVADGDVPAPASNSEIDAMDDYDALGAALYRYERLTVKYSLTEFIAGRTLAPATNQLSTINDANSNMVVIIMMISITTVLFIASGLYLNKRKQDR